ncbi:MAG: phosphate signaling complex protein PhoU [Oscillospiraceae bacterium]|nr:phosphate signaling complex protein PhoU [Oscillospiraceae bacterium]
MRDSYRKMLEKLHIDLIGLGALCEEAIGNAVRGLIEENTASREKVAELEQEINLKERMIETFCVKLLLREQPVAGDLRQITAAQGIIANMERIGDQAADIAKLSVFMVGSAVKSDIHIGDMARAAIKMLSDSVDSFVGSDLDKARRVIEYDDVIDRLFDRVKEELINLILTDSNHGGACLDLLMIAKYFERIGDHAQNIAEWVVYFITGAKC